MQQMIEGCFDPQVHAPNTVIHEGFTRDQVREFCVTREVERSGEAGGRGGGWARGGA